MFSCAGRGGERRDNAVPVYAAAQTGAALVATGAAEPQRPAAQA